MNLSRSLAVAVIADRIVYGQTDMMSAIPDNTVQQFDCLKCSEDTKVELNCNKSFTDARVKNRKNKTKK